MVDMHIDPYSFLGVTPNSSLSELRRAYYSLALLVHPDKGGSAHDMHILERSYNWIKTQLESVAERGNKTADDLQKEFDEFVAAQEAQKPPTISDIFAESIGYSEDLITNIIDNNGFTGMPPVSILYTLILPCLHMKWVKNKFLDVREIVKDELNKITSDNSRCNMFPASIEHGYGEDMVKSELEPVQHFGKHEIVEYTEPQSFFECKYTSGVSTSDIKTRLDDYTTSTKELYMTDYKHAFKEVDTTINSMFDPNTKDSFEILLEARRLERTKLTSESVPDHSRTPHSVVIKSDS